jgi:hypothetical protein
MRYLRKCNESVEENKIRDLDWSLIKDCLLETFDSVNTKAIFYFYSCNFNGGRKDDWYYNKYSGSSFGYGNSRITDIFTYDPETDKRENQPEDGDIFLRSYPNGSGLWGVEFKFEISDVKKVESISELNDISKYFEKCKNLTEDISSTVERLVERYDYKIGFEKDLFTAYTRTSDNSEKQFYHIKFSIWDREIREIMEKEYRWEETKFIN